jgi:Domain of unknown function (DUF4185)
MLNAPLVTAKAVTLVAQVTGEDSPNRTGSRFGFLATDLGILWDDGQGGVLAAFGDTYGEGWAGPGAGARSADHRRNVLLRSTTERSAGGTSIGTERSASGTSIGTETSASGTSLGTETSASGTSIGAADLSGGLLFDEAVRDRPGHAAEILPADPRRRIESTVIPTAGIAVDGVQYLHYMSVRRWGRPGSWRTNYGGVAYSYDRGMTWHKDPDARWRNSWLGRHPLQMGAFARDPAGEWVYLFGTRNGRFGPVYLARVEPSAVAEPRRYRMWTGAGWHRWWRRARPVAPGPCGELSVAFHRGLGVWLMLHLEDRPRGPGRIVLRAARQPTGPWSEPQTAVSGQDYPGLYGGYLHPGALDGDDIYFTMSQWAPYNVFFMHAELAVR